MNDQGSARTLVLAALMGCALPVHAIAPPNITNPVAREIQLQQERERLIRQQQETAPDVRLERQTAPQSLLPHNESPCFVIHEIKLIGELAARFQWALNAADLPNDPARGQCLGSTGINLVMSRIQNAIVEKGFVTTRVLAEPQDLNNGQLVLTLLPGKIRNIRFAENTNSRATKWNAVPAQSGDLLNLRDIEQALENFKRVPTAEADIQIVPADGSDANPGESDLVISWQQREIPFRLNLSLDDSGSKSTGTYQGGVTVSYDHWWTLNDLFYVSLNHDLGGGEDGQRGTHGYTAHYSVPYGYWLFSTTISGNDYFQTIAGANQDYRYSGSSRNAEIKISRLVWRDAVRKTTLSARGWTRSSRNYIDDTEVEVQRRQVSGWEAAVAHREFIGSSTLDINLAYRKGTGAMDALPAPEEIFGEGTSRLQVWNSDVNLNIPFSVLGQALRYSGNWRLQLNQTPLVPQDRFSIGGRFTVRGFDGESTLMGERGWLVRNDLGIALGDSGHEFYIAADYGSVGGPSTQFLLGTNLAGSVIGLRGGFKGFNYDLFVGKPIEKPKGFKTADTTAGFNLGWSY